VTRLLPRRQKGDADWPAPTPLPGPFASEYGLRFRVLKSFTCDGRMFKEGEVIAGSLCIAVHNEYPGRYLKQVTQREGG
jgi:hypothetical protein